MRAKFVGALLVLFAAGHAGAQLDDTERRIVAAVEEHSPAALALLEKTVRINSGTLNAQGVRAVGEIFLGEFEQLRATSYTAAERNVQPGRARCRHQRRARCRSDERDGLRQIERLTHSQ
ncbi:MAG TPA: hypothetical protein VIE63_17255 [Ramlibacter sp.]